MRVFRATLLAIGLSMWGTVGCVHPPPHAANDRSGDMAPGAVVRTQMAEFSIPVGSTRWWRWARRETEDNKLEYRWEVAITSGAESYRLGFSLFKFPGRRERAGSLRDL